MKAAIIFGSESDRAVMRKAADVLRELDVAFSAHIISAHRTPELLTEMVKRLEAEETGVIIAGAGLAAHLPGVIASQTLIPVIGVPISSGCLGGLDALLSMAQMPRPVPVAAVGVDNAANAGFLACEILALRDDALRKRLEEWRANMKIAFAASAEGVDL